MITNPAGLMPIDPSAYLTRQSELATGNPSVLCLLCEYGCSCPLSWWC